MLRQGQGEDKARSRQRKHNLNRNYNLMGFDTIEINLVLFIPSDPMKTITILRILRSYVSPKIRF